jgi:hypothetical protein
MVDLFVLLIECMVDLQSFIKLGVNLNLSIGVGGVEKDNNARWRNKKVLNKKVFLIRAQLRVKEL